MTGNLQMLMRLHDEVVAEEVGQMAELGYFDTEFTMYGCAYLENGKRYYKISPEAADIYTFIEKSNLRNIFPSNVYQYTKKCAVPAGMKEEIAQEVKLELAKRLSEEFPVDFFDTLHYLANRVTDNRANEYLWNMVDELEGLFEFEKIQRFENTLNYVYSCRRISEKEFLRLHKWLKDERKSMLENYISKDIFEKTMYGMMYLDDERPCYIENARMEYVYEKMYDIERKGGIVTPIFSKTYWYNYRYRLADVIRDYKAELKNRYTLTYLNEFEKVRCAEEYQDIFVDAVLQVRRKHGIKPAETLLRYGNRWGIYRSNMLKFSL